jgi:hypothetical protein
MALSEHSFMHFRAFDHRHAVSILNANHRLKTEIERILLGLELTVPNRIGRPDPWRPHLEIQKAFHRHGWKREALVSPRSSTRHYFDLLKERVAIEIEVSCRERLYRDYFRFLLAEREGRIDVGVVLLLDEDARYAHPVGLRNGLPRLEDAADDLTLLRDTIVVPIWVLALC